MAALVDFMNGPVGRAIRIIVGLALIWYGFVGPGKDTTAGVIIGVVGIIVGLLGIWGRCLLNGLAARGS